MGKATDEKTNVMRILDQKKVPYSPHDTPYAGGGLDEETAEAVLGCAPEQAFKTLVTKGASGGHYVFVVPVMKSLDLKAAAKAVGEKSVVMIRQAELLPLTGYIHGGCSPVGMKKTFPTVLDAEAEGLPTLRVSAGKVGKQVELAPEDLRALVGGHFAAVTTC